MQTSQDGARKTRFAALRDELATLSRTFAELKSRADQVAKDAGKRRDDWLLEHTKNEHLG